MRGIRGGYGRHPDPAATFRALFERDILIRDVGLPGALRVTAGTERETSAFIDALATSLKEQQ